jgi:sarcosine oxidase
MSSPQVVVVGAGVMGSATAWALARAGREVVALERFRIGHTRGSSHGRSRIFRLSYHDATYVRMAQEALPLWRLLEEDTGQSILHTTGGLDVGKALDAHAAALEACGAPFERLDGTEVSRRYPAVRLEPGAEALYQPDAAWVAADRAWAGFAAAARSRGAEVREGVRVLEITPGHRDVEVITDGGTLRPRTVVLALGGWIRAIAGPAGIEVDVRPTRETVAYFHIEEDSAIPALVDWGEPAVYSLFAPDHGIKVGEHIAGPDTDPEQEGQVSDASVRRLEDWIARRYPGATATAHLAEHCIYTNTPDESFILRREGQVVIGSPCSGHGFKFSPLIGHRLAALAVS